MKFKIKLKKLSGNKAMNSTNKIKVVRKNKRWLPKEVKLILDYLEQEQNIEAPTAQIYYKKLISKTGIDATWGLIKWKVRHLKNIYKKANDYLYSNKTSPLLDEDSGSETIEAKIVRICPYYNQLNRIFGKNDQRDMVFETIDIPGPSCDSFPTPQTEESASVSSFQLYDDMECNDSQNCNSFDSTIHISDNDDDDADHRTKTTITQRSRNEECPQKTIKYKQQSTSSYMTEIQKQRTTFYKMKFEWEREKYYEEVKINEKRLALEAEKTKADIEFKKKLLELKAREIARDEKLKILEMEKDERLKRYEIEMKYKNESNTTIQNHF